MTLQHPAPHLFVRPARSDKNKLSEKAKHQVHNSSIAILARRPAQRQLEEAEHDQREIHPVPSICALLLLLACKTAPCSSDVYQLALMLDAYQRLEPGGHATCAKKPHCIFIDKEVQAMHPQA